MATQTVQLERSMPLGESRRDATRSIDWRGDLLLLAAIVAVSVAVRVAALLFWGVGPIEGEGAEYARIAENIRKGIGYVGIASPGTELIFPPLFPLLISGASFFTGSYVWAGRIVSLVVGAFLPLPAFGIASRLFGRRAAFAAAGLTLFYPLLVNLSLTVFSEGPYATLLLSAIYVVVCALSRPTIRMWCFVGAAFGVAFMLRQEAVGALLIAAVFALAFTEGGSGIRCKRAAAAVVTFLLLVSPEIIFLHHYTGHFRLEVKSSFNLPLSIDIWSKGANPEADHSASFAINDKLEGVGIWMRPQADVVRDARISLRQVAHLVAFVARRNATTLLERLSSRWMGGPLLFALALLGALRRPWRGPLASSRLFVMLVPAAALAATWTVYFDSDRFYFVLVPFLLIWAANGLVEIGRWMKASLGALSKMWFAALASEYIVPGVIGLALVIYPIKAVRALDNFEEGSRGNHQIADVGLWIKQQQNYPVTIMDSTAPLAFHADAHLVWFPYCSAAVALRYLDAAKVDYVVLRRGVKFSQYYDDWLAGGIPDPRGQLVYVSPGPDPGEILVYRWHRADSHSSSGSNQASN